MNHLDEKSFKDFKSSYRDLFFKNLNVEFEKGKITTNFGDDWLKIKETELIESTVNINKNLLTAVNNYYFNRLDSKKKEDLNRIFEIKPVIIIKDTIISVKNTINQKLKETNYLLAEKSGVIRRKASVSILFRRLQLLTFFPIRLILTGFAMATLFSILLKFSSESIEFAQTEFPWLPPLINEITTIIDLQFNVSIMQIITKYYWIIVIILTLLTVVLIKNIFKPFVKYRRTVSLTNSMRNQKVSEIADLIIADLKNNVDAEVWIIYEESFLKALNDYCDKINMSLNQVKNPVIDLLHEFEASSKNMLTHYSPGKVASSCGSNIFSYGFVSDIISMVSKRQLTNDQLNSTIEQHIQRNVTIIERKVKETVNNDIHNMLNNYFEMMSKQGRDVSEIGGVSLKEFEQQLSSRLNIPTTAISISMFSIDAKSADIISNAIIGAGAIGGAMLAGGAGIALVASGPIGLIAGALWGGNLFLSNKEGISKFIKNLFGGDPSEKLKDHFNAIEKNVISDIERKIDPAYTNIKKTLNDITKDYIDAVIKEVSSKQILYLEK